ncbi:MAG: phenylalanine--tRNA ligase subunit beta, partial [Planctomycetota bacterium]
LENGDLVIDLEVTSNRGDCLGHLGVAREIGVLYDTQLRIPEIAIEEKIGGEPVESSVRVENQFLDACPRYTARLIRGVKIGPSPEWLVQALTAIGIGVVNNVVDITNYVMHECGQPLHAFDFANVTDGKIVVRPARDGETLTAIDHKQYPLRESMCVIADSKDALAVAGVMGGAASEVTSDTTDVLLEAAVFTPLSVRRAARSLRLSSPSSYRFERRVDPVGVDWASRRACDLIVQFAGGQICPGIVDTAPDISSRSPVVLRLSQLERILGISIPGETVHKILQDLGCRAEKSDDAAQQTRWTPPSWRHDLTREADLIEEVARIYGYEKIPEDHPVPVTPSTRRPFDIALDTVRMTMVAAGFSEAMTPSVVTKDVDGLFSPWTENAAIQTRVPMLKGARRVRRSLVPALVASR